MFVLGVNVGNAVFVIVNVDFVLLRFAFGLVELVFDLIPLLGRLGTAVSITRSIFRITRFFLVVFDIALGILVASAALPATACPMRSGASSTVTLGANPFVAAPSARRPAGK